MAQTNVNIRMDEQLKKEAELLFKEIGLNMSAAVNMFVKQVIRQRKIPFEITAEPKAEILTALQEADR